MYLRPVLAFALITAAINLMSGCTTYRYVAEPVATEPSTTASDVDVAFHIAPTNLTHAKARFREAAQKGMKFDDFDRLKKLMDSQLHGLPTPTSEDELPPTPTLQMELIGDFKPNWTAILPILTLGILPGAKDTTMQSELRVGSEGENLFSSQVSGGIRSYMSIYTPLPLLWGNRNADIVYEEMAADMIKRHQLALNQWVATEKQRYQQQIAGKSMAQQRQWLIENPHSLFASDVLTQLASNPQGNTPLEWHRENSALFPNYVAHLDASDRLWFVGPEGQRVVDLAESIRHGTDQKILATRVEKTGPYKTFNDAEIRRLKSAGFSSSLISAMIRSQPPVVATTISTPKSETMASLLINNNSGAYMNPWTSDGVLAEWVDKAINAKMGGAVGSAVGAYAASKALENVPFIGGILGSKIGNEMGRNAAISASGGMDYIRETSDLSFRNLNDMARYMKAHYATESHFQDAIKAADAIYPGLLKAIASAR